MKVATDATDNSSSEIRNTSSPAARVLMNNTSAESI